MCDSDPPAPAGVVSLRLFLVVALISALLFIVHQLSYALLEAFS